MAEHSITITEVFLIVAGGIVPTLIWLWFWLKEDKKRPEPGRLIMMCFTAGFLSVAVAIIAEGMIQGMTNQFFPGKIIIPIALFALTEEIVKYLAVYLIAFRNKNFDEPIDAIVYMITGALGFSAMENILYITAAIQQSGPLLGVIAGNLRFVGATLLHIATSGIVGIAIGLAFYMNAKRKHTHLVAGLITASLLHTIFNLSIISTKNIGDILFVFLILWLVIVIMMLFFEKVKKVRPETSIPLSTQ